MSQMWRRRRNAKNVAEALIEYLGDDASAEVCRRELDAGSEPLAAEWRNLARAVDRLTCRRRGLDIALQTATDLANVLDPGKCEGPAAVADPMRDLLRIIGGQRAEPGPGRDNLSEFSNRRRRSASGRRIAHSRAG